MECAFGILQQRFNIVATPAMGWDKGDLNEIMMTCIILHNMIIEFQRDKGEDSDSVSNLRTETFTYHPLREEQGGLPEQFLERWRSIMSRPMHLQLQRDLVDHQWMRLGES